jgi:hypothetical protein
MQVLAFSTPTRPEWRWRIVSFSGAVVEESFETFSSIAMAVSEGSRRLNELAERDARPNSPVRGRGERGGDR